MVKSAAVRGAAGMLALVALLGACSGATPTTPQATTASPSTATAPAQPQPLNSPVERSPAMDSPLDTPAAEPDLIGQAGVDAVVLHLDTATPPRLVARVTGYLGDACTRLGDIEQALNATVIQVSVQTVRPAGRMCAQVIKDFEQEVVIKTAGLAPGDYTVNVNGVVKPFKIDANGISLPRS